MNFIPSRERWEEILRGDPFSPGGYPEILRVPFWIGERGTKITMILGSEILPEILLLGPIYYNI